MCLKEELCVLTESSLHLERWISQKVMGSVEMLKSVLIGEDLPSPRHEDMKHQLVSCPGKEPLFLCVSLSPELF